MKVKLLGTGTIQGCDLTQGQFKSGLMIKICVKKIGKNGDFYWHGYNYRQRIQNKKLKICYFKTFDQWIPLVVESVG